MITILDSRNEPGWSNQKRNKYNCDCTYNCPPQDPNDCLKTCNLFYQQLSDHISNIHQSCVRNSSSDDCRHQFNKISDELFEINPKELLRLLLELLFTISTSEAFRQYLPLIPFIVWLMAVIGSIIGPIDALNTLLGVDLSLLEGTL